MSASLSTVVGSVFSSAVLMILLAYIRDRRSIRAKGTVAERTVDVQVDADRLRLLEGRLTLLNQTFDAERSAMQATIAHLRADLEAERAESDKKDRKIAELVKRVEDIQTSLDTVKSELAETRRSEP